MSAKLKALNRTESVPAEAARVFQIFKNLISTELSQLPDKDETLGIHDAHEDQESLVKEARRGEEEGRGGAREAEEEGRREEGRLG